LHGALTSQVIIIARTGVQEFKMRVKNKLTLLAFLPVMALGACAVAPPSGPSVVAMPGQGKSFPQFQQDDEYCRNYAQSKTADAAQVSANAQNNATTTAVAGTLIGAATGAALGSLSGNVGAGAGIGAGAGLLGGAAVAGGNTQAAADSLQGRYDVAYAQCMVGNGETIQQPQGPAVVYAAPPPPPPVIVAPGYYYGPRPYPY
jgi:hypothetical protein